ncbi:crotonase/enoyl-CoA hydratase family protein [Sansalvadorimonas sp. 2012CJ34-2]|uniref:Crotonase/enoyl-CoA hydratase family protein n=1 Tax=Parendozoicomonas callyspongiae TaxID=2942213 RepID=A0ABT0PAZ2_9GAMM|nr:crotonase/enoyl-CoA hydratase family protein [Sansalvadorimonas sp. 2012CJ34-2]MCL6268514.1 crotonase/enoyl-CoA hydratase family protein [Sansalvadorimonas sp. 2012CJ34-2]
MSNLAGVQSSNIEDSRVLFRVEEHIAYVSLNRPDKHNGLDYLLFRELIATAKKIRKNKAVRAVILSGEGDSFCAGLDFKSVSKTPSMVPKLFLKLPWTSMNAFQQVAYTWKRLPVPVISAIHGNCFGGGLQIALGTDFRVIHPEAKLSIMEIKWGLIPDMSATATLSTLTRYDIAEELTMTGKVFSGQEAFSYGLATRVTEHPMREAKALAKLISEKSPDAIAASKYLYRKTWNAGPRLSLLWERLIQMRLLGRKNQRIAMSNGLAGKDKEPKPFEDRSLF